MHLFSSGVCIKHELWKFCFFKDVVLLEGTNISSDTYIDDIITVDDGKGAWTVFWASQLYQTRLFGDLCTLKWTEHWTPLHCQASVVAL